MAVKTERERERERERLKGTTDIAHASFLMSVLRVMPGDVSKLVIRLAKLFTTLHITICSDMEVVNAVLCMFVLQQRETALDIARRKDSDDLIVLLTNVKVCQYRVRQKSNPLKIFAVFSTSAWSFSVKCSYLHLIAKQHLTSCAGGCHNMPPPPAS